MVYRLKKYIRILLIILSVCQIVIILAICLCIRAYEYHHITRQAFSRRMILASVLDGIRSETPLDDDGNIRNIRVGIANTDFTSLFHEQVIISGKDLCLYRCESNEYACGNDNISMLDKSLFSMNGNNDTLVFDRDNVKTNDLYKITSSDMICIESILRKGKAPVYEGSIYIYMIDEGIIICNELDLETYLYYVVPSEMPPGYSYEALKAQAVCARSFAINQMEKSQYKQYGIDLVDNTNSQMYNNCGTDESIIKAVDDTKGEVLIKGNSIITAYYYATSCGMSAIPKDIWGGDDIDAYAYGLFSKGGSVLKVDFSKEDDFKEFIDNTSLKRESVTGNTVSEHIRTYETGKPMYRWSCEADVDTMSAAFICNYDRLYYNNRDKIKTMEQSYEIGGKKLLSGKISDIKVTKRGNTGVVMQIMVTIGDSKIIISGCELIRSILSTNAYSLRMNNDSVQNFKIIPSGFYYPVISDDKIIFKGGGYGHGVGMSQDGADEMGGDGYTYKKILKIYYPGTDLADDKTFLNKVLTY